MYLQKVISRKTLFISFLLASWRLMMKIAGSGSKSGSESGSISQKHRSADPDPDPDPRQNFMDAQHWNQLNLPICCRALARREKMGSVRKVCPSTSASTLAWPSHVILHSQGYKAVLRIRDVYPGSRIRIFPHPGSRILDPGSKTAIKERGEKNLLYTFFCSYKFHKIENYFIFGMLKKKIWANF